MSTFGQPAPTFSYAQAAKGLAPSIQNKSTAPSSASSEHGSKELPSSLIPIAAQTIPEPAHTVINTLNDTIPNGRPYTTKIEEDNHVQSSDSESREQDNFTAITTSDIKPEFTMETDETNIMDTTSTFEGRSGLPEHDEEKIHLDDQDKNKETDDDWEKVSVPSVTAEKELKAAPIPAVNIWQQRKEAHDAKYKEIVAHRQPSVSTVPKQKSQPQTTREEGKRKSTAKETTNDKDVATQRRTNSGNRSHPTDRKEQSPSQSSPRSLSKHGEKNGAPPPSTGDTESWPTPESAGDERRRSTTHDKTEKPDKATSQKKWIQMPFVPTAKFETQLPPAANARRGGRTGNRGRDSANRGAHASSTQNIDKTEPASMGPPPPRQATEQDRGRKGESTREKRASSVPSHVRRSTSHEESNTGFRKASAIHQRDQAEPAKAQANVSHAVATVNDETSVTDDSRSSSQHPRPGPSAAPKFDSDAVSIEISSGQSGLDNGSRNNAPNDRNRRASRDEFRTSAEFGERSFPPGREWSRGRPDSNREKSDSWRDRRESRPERGRGGYRGRGNHSNYNGHPQTFTAPLPQNGFETAKSFSNDGRNRQTSQPFNQTQPGGATRAPGRAQSIPVPPLQNTFYSPVSAFPQSLSPMQGDMAYGGFPGQIPSGIMNAMPYADQLQSAALIAMISTQLGYYFSINNLCKDLFLRKNMDSQGFVPLSVIAGFKRIQALTEGTISHEQFRAICQSSAQIEFVTTEDGEDKLRARENWKDFILPTEERFPTAQNDGPSRIPQQRHHSSQVIYNLPSPNGPIKNPPHMNGFSEPFVSASQTMSYPPPPPAPFDGSVHEGPVTRSEAQFIDQGRRSSATSPLSQIQSPTITDKVRSSSFMTNGHHRSSSTATSSTNVFPDNRIPELKMVVRDPGFEANQSDGSETQKSKLRGGAGSPQQLDRFKHIQFGQSSPTEDDQTPFWTKHGHMAKVPEGPSYVHESYLSLRHKALMQRDDNHFDGALAVLYPFWSTFLPDNFNLSLYQDFASFAGEEAASGSHIGQNHLRNFYEAMLKRKAPISDRIANDIVDMFRREHEHGNKGPTFETLRAALRNGATDFKTVKRIMDLLSSGEKAELGI